MGDQHVTAVAQRGIGGCPAVSIATATFEAKHQFRNRNRFAASPIDFRQHFVNLRHGSFNSLSHPSLILNIHHQRLIGGWRIPQLQQAAIFHQEGSLGRLAPESNHDVGPNVGMTSDVGQRAGQLLMIISAILDGTTATMDQRNDAVDVGEISQDLLIKFLCRIF